MGQDHVALVSNMSRILLFCFFRCHLADTCVPGSPCSFLLGFASTYPRLVEWSHPLYSGSRRTRFPDGDGPRWSCMAGVAAFVRGSCRADGCCVTSRGGTLSWGSYRGVALSWFGCGVRGYRSGARKCRYHVALVPTYSRYNFVVAPSGHLLATPPPLFSVVRGGGYRTRFPN